MKKYNIGEIVPVYVTGIEKYGIFVKLDEKCNGLIHISEITGGFIRNINDYVKIGEKIKAKIINIDLKKQRIKLSIKEVDYRMNKKKNTILEATKSDFSTLSLMLDKWTDDKIKEILIEKTKK